MPEEKLTSIREAIGMVPDGATVAIQNMATQSAPMAAVPEERREDDEEEGESSAPSPESRAISSLVARAIRSDDSLVVAEEGDQGS